MNDPRFYAPSETEAQEQLTPEQLAEFQRLAASLQDSYAPVPGTFYLPGWVWVQIALAKRNGCIDAALLTQALDQSYNELLIHLSESK
jgi:hypothetical protein